MKLAYLALPLSALVMSSSHATPLITKLLHHKKPQVQVSQLPVARISPAVDFSGVWEGACYEGESMPEVLMLSLNQDKTAITVNNEITLPIGGGILSETEEGGESLSFRLNWSADGQKLAFSFLQSVLSLNDSYKSWDVSLGNSTLSLVNDELHIDDHVSAFKDGEPDSLNSSELAHCVFKRVDK